MQDLSRLLQVCHLRTSVYHPQTDGLVEGFNQTLKRMLHQVVDMEGCNWDLLLQWHRQAFLAEPQQQLPRRDAAPAGIETQKRRHCQLSRLARYAGQGHEIRHGWRQLDLPNFSAVRDYLNCQHGSCGSKD